MSENRFRLTDFVLDGYAKGRSLLWQASWFAVMNLVFTKWWCPNEARIRILRLFGAQVGDGVIVRHRVRVLWPWKLQIGDGSWIGEGVWLLNLEPIYVGANVCISQEAYLCTGSHHRRDARFRYDNAPIRVLDGSWIATQALVLRGVTVGEKAVVGARAIVASSVASGAAVAAGSVTEP